MATVCVPHTSMMPHLPAQRAGQPADFLQQGAARARSEEAEAQAESGRFSRAPASSKSLRRSSASAESRISIAYPA